MSKDDTINATENAVLLVQQTGIEIGAETEI